MVNMNLSQQMLKNILNGYLSDDEVISVATLRSALYALQSTLEQEHDVVLGRIPDTGVTAAFDDAQALSILERSLEDIIQVVSSL